MVVNKNARWWPEDIRRVILFIDAACLLRLWSGFCHHRGRFGCIRWLCRGRRLFRSFIRVNTWPNLRRGAWRRGTRRNRSAKHGRCSRVIGAVCICDWIRRRGFRRNSTGLPYLADVTFIDLKFNYISFWIWRHRRQDDIFAVNI